MGGGGGWVVLVAYRIIVSAQFQSQFLSSGPWTLGLDFGLTIDRNSFKFFLSGFQCTNWVKIELEPDDSQFSGNPVIGMDEL